MTGEETIAHDKAHNEGFAHGTKQAEANMATNVRIMLHLLTELRTEGRHSVHCVVLMCLDAWLRDRGAFELPEDCDF